jgi:clan AA aspartic protease (TIGR02281 family)
MKADPRFRPKQEDNDSNKITKWLLLVVAVAGGIFLSASAFNYWSKSHSDSIVGPGALAHLDSVSNELVQRLNGEPCNQALAYQLATNLFQQDEYKALVILSQNQTRQCGADDRLLPLVFPAQMGLSDFIGAEKTANSIIIQFPADPSAFGWRSQAREKQGNFPGAYLDMQKALLLFPDPSVIAEQVYYDTARLAAKSGHPCDAVLTLRDFIAYDAHARRDQQISTLMQDWQKQGNCPPLSGTGNATLRYNANAAGIIVPVEVNGFQTHMLLDTGATRTFISSSFAKQAGIEKLDLQGDIVSTANGNTTVMTGRAEKISIGGANLKNVPVYIQNSNSAALGEGIDGLLGLSFLGNFQVHIANGTLELKPLQ